MKRRKRSTRRTQVATAVEPLVVDSPGRRHVADLEVIPVRVIRDHERGVLRPEEVRPSRARHAGIEKYGGIPPVDPRSYAVTEPRLGWKLTNAPQPTGIRVGAPVIM